MPHNERPLSALCEGLGAGRAATATNVRSYVLRPSLCCTAVSRISALRDGPGADRSAPATNVRSCVLRALACRTALGPLSALRVAAGFVSIPYFTKQPVFPQGAPAQASIIPFRGAAPPSLGGLLSGCGSTRDPFALKGSYIQRQREVEKDRMVSDHCKLTTAPTKSLASEKRGR